MQTIHLGECLIHADVDRITRAGETRDVPRKVMAVLQLLLSRAGEVVTKEELVAEVWEGQATDEVLATTLYELRRALGDDARTPRYIETIRKRGYRLVARATGPEEVRVPSGWTRRPLRRIAVASGVLVLLVASFVASGTWRSHAPICPEPITPSDVSEAACDAYLKGRHFLTLGTKAGLENAIRYFEKATALQPELAIAHIGLAECYTTGDWSQLDLSWQEAYEAASAAAERAQALVGQDPDVVAMFATIRFRHEWDWQGAAAGFRSIQTVGDPCRTWNNAVYAEFLSASGQHEEAIRILRELLRTEPLSLRLNGGLAWALYLSGDLAACRRQLEQTIQLYPTEARLHELLGDVRVLIGDSAGAAQAYARADQVAGEARPDANPVRRARTEALMGRPAEALGLILEAIEQRSTGLVWIDQDPALEAVRALPMYRIARSRLNLAT